MKFFTYILYSKKIDEYYTWSTENLEARLFRHNKRYNKSTKRGVAWKVWCFEEYETRSEAYKRETEIKKYKKREGFSGVEQKIK